MGRAEKKLATVKRKALQPKALDLEIEPQRDYMKPGNRPVEHAFQLVSLGFDMFVYLLDNGYPSVDPKALKRAPKWGRQNLLFTGASVAVIMAHALPKLLATLDGRLSEEHRAEGEVPAERHLEALRSVRNFFPLPAGIMGYSIVCGKRGDRPTQPFLDYCMAEFKVMETREARPAVAAGDEKGSEYSSALLRGENPDEDPRLVEEQRGWARDYFINVAFSAAVLDNTDRRDLRTVGPKLVELWKDDGPAVEAYRARAVAAWVEGSRDYHRYLALDSQGAEAPARQ